MSKEPENRQKLNPLTVSKGVRRNYKLKIAYDGAPYLGWQKTREGPSIEECLEKALIPLLKETPYLQAASRTDRGVHAEEQIVNFTASSLDLKKTLRSLNGLLPESIRALNIEEVDMTFHPSCNAESKEYHYRVSPERIQCPFDRFRAWHYYYPLNYDSMRAAASTLLGTHNFAPFSNAQVDPKEVTLCTLQDLTLVEGKLVTIRLRANRFLYKMARNLVGTLLAIGAEKISPEGLFDKKRDELGPTAPAHGLTLYRVYY